MDLRRWQIRFNPPRDEWTRFWKNSPERSIFSTNDFVDSLATEYHRVLASVNGEVRCGAIFPAPATGLPFTGTHPHTSYQGLMLADARSSGSAMEVGVEAEGALALFDAIADLSGGAHLSNSWRLRDARPFGWFSHQFEERGKFELSTRYTAILPLEGHSNFDEILSSMRSNRPRYWRRGKRNLEIAVSSDIGEFVDLHRQTLIRSGALIPVNSQALVTSIARRALDRGYGEILCARHEGKTISANLFLWDDRTCFYLFGANNLSSEFRSLQAGTTLMIEAIFRAFERGIAEVDFVGANSPNRGDYKLSFGAHLHLYNEATLLRSR